MKIFAETERLILREIVSTDEDGFFELDSDKEVHRYLGNNPVTNMAQIRTVIQMVRQQYIDNGIGRWAIIEKETNSFMGWTGLKLVKENTNSHINFYDIGYRIIRKHWGKGIATESAIASLNYAFNKLNTDVIYGTTHIENLASRKVLEKIGLHFVDTFEHNNITCNWLKIRRNEWLLNKNE